MTICKAVQSVTRH